MSSLLSLGGTSERRRLRFRAPWRSSAAVSVAEELEIVRAPGFVRHVRRCAFPSSLELEHQARRRIEDELGLELAAPAAPPHLVGEPLDAEAMRRTELDARRSKPGEIEPQLAAPARVDRNARNVPRKRAGLRRPLGKVSLKLSIISQPPRSGAAAMTRP
jgi:hypothetical protein